MLEQKETAAGQGVAGGEPATCNLPTREGQPAACNVEEPESVGSLKALELSLAEQTQQNEGLGKNLKEVEGQLEKTRSDLGQATERYRKLVFTVHPDIPAELIAGASIQEIDASLEKAKALVEKIRESLVKQGRGVIPAGAPVRSAPDYSGLSPRDKIKAGLRR